MLSFLSGSLWGLQEAEEDLVQSVATRASDILAEAKDRVGRDKLELAARTGFSLSSTERLISALSAESDHFSVEQEVGVDAYTDLLPRLLSALSGVTEVHKGLLRRTDNWSAHLEPLKAWIGGRAYRDVLRIARTSGALGSKAKLGDAVKYCTDLSNWLSWGFGACFTVLSEMLQSPHPWIGLLPLYTRYGVGDPTAAYLSLLGVPDRAVALVLGARFNVGEQIPTLGNVSEWVSRSADVLREIFPDEDVRYQIVRNHIFGRGFSPRPYAIARAITYDRVDVGDVLLLAPAHDERIMLVKDSVNGGFLTDPGAIPNFSLRRLDNFVCVMLGEIEESGQTNVAVVTV